MVWPFSYLCLQPPFLPPLTSHFIYILGIPKKLLSLGMRFILWCFSLTSFQPGMLSSVSFASAATPGSSPQGGLSRCPRPGSVPSPLRPELCSPTILSPPLALEYWKVKGTDLGPDCLGSNSNWSWVDYLICVSISLSVKWIEQDSPLGIVMKINCVHTTHISLNTVPGT